MKGRYESKCGNIYPNAKYDVKIPKIIYQSWKDKNNIPEHWKPSIRNIKKYMPDWKHVLMDDEDNRLMVAKHFPDFLPYYDALPYKICKVDFSRYVFLYLYGGIYMDLDLIIQRDLSPLFVNDSEIYLVNSGNVSSSYTNSFMASKPKCKFWLECMEEIKKPLPWYAIGAHWKIMLLSGPLMVSRVAAKTKTTVSVLPRKLIMPCSSCDYNCNTCNAYIKPSLGQSWCQFDSHFYNFWLCKWRYILSCLICILIVLLAFYVLYQLDICPINVFSTDILQFFN
jgi:mannosyltransferase OCH1-like enzyme